MRLTLRTLLAYLDDRLPPANAREIGQKITNSPFATELVERIRDVKRKRRLASPAKPLPMIDANLVAEYLDDQLTPELVARVEREILASDAMLAEVAASHEILGLIREPVSVDPRLFDRLYSLDPTGNTDVVRTLGRQSQPSQNVAAEAPEWKPLASRLTSSRRFSAVIAALLALVWIVVVASDSDLFVSPTSPGNETENGGGMELAGAPDAEAPKGEVHQTDEVGGKVADATDAEAKVPAGSGPVAELATATDESMAPEADSGKGAAVVSVNNAEPDLNASAAKTASPAGVPVASTEKQPAEVKPAVDSAAGVNPEIAELKPVLLMADSRIVLVFNEEQHRWTELSQIPGGEAVELVPNTVDCGPLLGKQWFGVPLPFRASVAMGGAGWTATLPGPTLVRIHDAPPGGLDVLAGRLRLSADRATAWDDQKLPVFILGTGSKTSLITLQSQDAQAAIEVIPLAAESSGLDQRATEPRGSYLPLDADLRVQVTVLDGSLGLKSPGSEGETRLIKGKRASWTILDMNEFSSLTIDNGESIAAAPAWLFETDVPEVPEQAVLKKRLLSSLGSPNEPGESVLPLLADRNPQVGVLAVNVLNLIGDVDRLLSILYEPRDESIHRAAIDGLASIANSSHAGRAAIIQGLETRLPMAEIDITAQLILGITPAQASDPGVALDLMALLSNDRLATRTLAIYRMEQLTGDRMGFHPEAEASRRREAIRRWQKYLDRNSGKLVP